ncbi:MAG TPA: hypothetical protein VGA77_02020 [Propylenella sp.]
MNTITRVLRGALFLMIFGSTAGAITLPPAGDCGAMAAQGIRPLWLGEFSGTYEDFSERRRMIAARGCFPTEYACRRWINEVQSAVIFPGLMTCRPFN